MASTTEIGATLAQLEELALDPFTLDNEDSIGTLRRLQYRLHIASETTEGELGEALAAARDATSGLATAVEEQGTEALELFVHEWRGALFRVRLARMRLEEPAPRDEPFDPVAAPPRQRAIAAFALVIAGAISFAAGAGLDEWPVWTAGMLAVCGSFLAYKP